MHNPASAEEPPLRIDAIRPPTGTGTRAQGKTWSIEDCIEYAVENNPEIRIRETECAIANRNLASEKLKMLPYVEISFPTNMYWGKSVNINDLEIISGKLNFSSSMSVSASMNIFNGLRTFNSIRSMKKSYELSKYMKDIAVNETELSIIQAFLQVLSDKMLLEIAENGYNAMRQQVSAAEKLAGSGALAYGSLAELKSGLASEKVGLTEATFNLKSSWIRLKELMNIPYDTEMEIDGYNASGETVPPPYIPDIDIIYANALKMPQIKHAEAELEKNEIETMIAKGSFMPSVSVSAGYGSYFTISDIPVKSQLALNASPSFSIGISLPVSNYPSAALEVKTRKLMSEKLEMQISQGKKQLYGELVKILNDTYSYYEQYIESVENERAMQESFRYVSEKFALGMSSATDLVLAKSRFDEASAKMVTAKLRYLFQLKIIEFYIRPR